jgi:hypothetical protein
VHRRALLSENGMEARSDKGDEALNQLDARARSVAWA